MFFFLQIYTTRGQKLNIIVYRSFNCYLLQAFLLYAGENDKANFDY